MAGHSNGPAALLRADGHGHVHSTACAVALEAGTLDSADALLGPITNGPERPVQRLSKGRCSSYRKVPYCQAQVTVLESDHDP